jgi:hypothetical protein
MAHPVAVDVQLMDKRGEDYVPPAYIAFSGPAATLGRQSEGGYVFSPAALLSIMTTATGNETTVQVRTHNNKKLRIKYVCFFVFP